MPWEVIIGDEVGEWLDGIDEGTYELIIAALNVLEREGPSLGRPLVDTIKGTDIKNMKEPPRFQEPVGSPDSLRIRPRKESHSAGGRR